MQALLGQTGYGITCFYVYPFIVCTHIAPSTKLKGYYLRRFKCYGCCLCTDSWEQYLKIVEHFWAFNKPERQKVPALHCQLNFSISFIYFFYLALPGLDWAIWDLVPDQGIIASYPTLESLESFFFFNLELVGSLES